MILFQDIDNFEEKLNLKTSEAEAVIPHISSGEIISDKKSHFQPHVAEVNSMTDVKLVTVE